MDFKEVIRAEAETIKISLSGMTQEVYGKTHARENIETVEENMLEVKFTDLPHRELQALKYEHDFCKTCYKSHLSWLPIPTNQPEQNDVTHERQKENLYRKFRQSRGQD